jgi:predicted transposase YdaD
MSVKRNDILLKGALEDFFGYFLLMIFPNAKEIFDFSKGFIFLDQELSEISVSDEVRHPKVIDKLTRVHLKSGEQAWVRVHVEIEKNAKKGFGRRMFRYFSRLFDKYDIPVISIAVFLEKRNKNNKPKYQYSFHGTGIDYRFNTMYLAELDDIELSKSANPFAKVLLITKLAIQKNLSIEDVFERKKILARQLLSLDIKSDEIRSLLDFLKRYVHFEKKEIRDKFEEELKVLTNKSETMGITEMIREMDRQEGMKVGKHQSIEEISRNLLKEGLDIELIHKTTSIPIIRLKKMQKELAKN